MSRISAVCALGAALTLAACGSSSGTATSPSTTPRATGSVSSSPSPTATDDPATRGWVTMSITDAPATVEVPPTWSMHSNGHVIDAGFDSPSTKFLLEFQVIPNIVALGDKQDLAQTDRVATVGMKHAQRLDQVFYGMPMDHFTGRGDSGETVDAFAALSRTGNSVGIQFIYDPACNLTPAQRDATEKTVMSTLTWPTK